MSMDVLMTDEAVKPKAKPKKKTRKKGELWSKQSLYTTVDGFDVMMDSTWEVALAKKLDELGIKWHRDENMILEYRTVRGRKRKYIPDFYLPDYDLYVEVKGYWTDAARYKMKDVVERNQVEMLILESLADIEDVAERIPKDKNARD
jgi:predicted nuclease of restriction endonuclease-like RecB superfamily